MEPPHVSRGRRPWDGKSSARPNSQRMMASETPTLVRMCLGFPHVGTGKNPCYFLWKSNENQSHMFVWLQGGVPVGFGTSSRIVMSFGYLNLLRHSTRGVFTHVWPFKRSDQNGVFSPRKRDTFLADSNLTTRYKSNYPLQPHSSSFSSTSMFWVNTNLCGNIEVLVGPQHHFLRGAWI